MRRTSDVGRRVCVEQALVNGKTASETGNYVTIDFYTKRPSAHYTRSTDNKMWFLSRLCAVCTSCEYRTAADDECVRHRPGSRRMETVAKSRGINSKR